MGGVNSGKRRMPTALRVLHGETRPSKVNYHEPKPLPGDLLPPPTLTEQAHEVWTYTVAHLHPTRVLTTTDREALAIYCEHVVNHRELVALLRRSSMLIKASGHGDAQMLVKNPLVQMLRGEAHLLRGYMQEFGLTPSARASLVVPAETYDDVEALLS